MTIIISFLIVTFIYNLNFLNLYKTLEKEYSLPTLFSIGQNILEKNSLLIYEYPLQYSYINYINILWGNTSSIFINFLIKNLPYLFDIYFFILIIGILLCSQIKSSLTTKRYFSYKTSIIYDSINNYL
jgi:hypothetical protein